MKTNVSGIMEPHVPDEISYKSMIFKTPLSYIDPETEMVHLLTVSDPNYDTLMGQFRDYCDQYDRESYEFFCSVDNRLQLLKFI